jgi:hypothetical protein
MGFSDPMYFDNPSYVGPICICCSKREPYQNPADGVYDNRCIHCMFSCVDGVFCRNNICHRVSIKSMPPPAKYYYHKYGSKCLECGTAGSVLPGDVMCHGCRFQATMKLDPRDRKEEDYMIAFAARCSKHLKYKAKLKPTTGCQACEFLFKVAQQKEMNTTYPDGSSVEWERLKEKEED